MDAKLLNTKSMVVINYNQIVRKEIMKTSGKELFKLSVRSDADKSPS